MFYQIREPSAETLYAIS